MSFCAFFSSTKYTSPLTGIRSAGLSNFVDASFEPADDVHSFVPFAPRDLLLKKKIDQCRRLSVSMVGANHLDQSQHFFSLAGRRQLPRKHVPMLCMSSKPR